MCIKETIKKLEGYVISCVDRDVATGKPYVDWEAFGVLIEAYKQSKWVEFDIKDQSTHPRDKQRVIVETGLGIFMGNFHAEYTCPEFGDIDAGYFEFCTDKGWLDNIEVCRWQPLAEPPQK